MTYHLKWYHFNTKEIRMTLNWCNDTQIISTGRKSHAIWLYEHAPPPPRNNARHPWCECAYKSPIFRSATFVQRRGLVVAFTPSKRKVGGSKPAFTQLSFFFLFNSCFPNAIFFSKFMYPVITVVIMKSLWLFEGEKIDISVRLVCPVGMAKTAKECRMRALRKKLF